MKKLSEKINRKSTGGLMKLRSLALVTLTIAIMTSGVASAQATGNPTANANPDPFKVGIAASGSLNLFEISGDPVKKSPQDFLNFLAGNNGSSGNKSQGYSMFKCVIEERGVIDKAIDLTDVIFKGLLGFRALKIQGERDVLQYKYQTDVATLNNTWRMMDSALNYSTQQQVAYWGYRYGSMYGNNSNGSYANNGVRAYANDTYANYVDQWSGNII